jgi:hypothetical protein
LNLKLTTATEQKAAEAQTEKKSTTWLWDRSTCERRLAVEGESTVAAHDEGAFVGSDCSRGRTSETEKVELGVFTHNTFDVPSRVTKLCRRNTSIPSIGTYI